MNTISDSVNVSTKGLYNLLLGRRQVKPYRNYKYLEFQNKLKIIQLGEKKEVPILKFFKRIYNMAEKIIKSSQLN